MTRKVDPRQANYEVSEFSDFSQMTKPSMRAGCPSLVKRLLTPRRFVPRHWVEGDREEASHG